MPAIREPDPVPPPLDTSNLDALTELLLVFHDLSDESVPDVATLRRETTFRWKLWESAASLELRSAELGGRFSINLLEKTLRVRFLSDDAGCVVRLLIRLDSPLGLVAQAMDFADHYAADEVAAALLRRIQDCGLLARLEWSLVKALMRRLSVDDLARELEREVEG